MSARDDILAAIRARRVTQAPEPLPYTAPQVEGDLLQAFARKIASYNAGVRMLASMDEVPEAVAETLRARNMAARVHIATGSELESLPLPNIDVRHDPPGQFDAALTLAPFAIAETGTLAYPASKGAPASWHFRPELEIAVVRADAVVAGLEDVLAALRADGGLPSTLNLVSGPSRTGDIEQTLELGAHGPKALAVLLIQG